MDNRIANLDQDWLISLAQQWEARARSAHPSDAMLINKHVRELREAAAAARPVPPSAPVTASMVNGIMAQRDEILRAFVAKYGFHPEDTVQVHAPDGSWRIKRRGGRPAAFRRHYPDGGHSGWYDANVEADLLQALQQSGVSIEFAYFGADTRSARG